MSACMCVTYFDGVLKRMHTFPGLYSEGVHGTEVKT